MLSLVSSERLQLAATEFFIHQTPCIAEVIVCPALCHTQVQIDFVAAQDLQSFPARFHQFAYATAHDQSGVIVIRMAGY
jgi:hypothetical protein